MATSGRRMSRYLLLLLLVCQLVCLIECAVGKDPDDYEDLEEEEDDAVIFEDDELPNPPAHESRPLSDEKLTPEDFYKLMRPRLGHFERYPELRRLYEDYFEKSMRARDKLMGKISKAEDWRALRPTADFCVSFLRSFKSKGYKINKPMDIIPLDACLEWVFLDEISVDKGDPDYDRMERAVSERELDIKNSASSLISSRADELRADQVLESFYRDTLFAIPDQYELVEGKRLVRERGVPRRMRLKLKKYLLRLLDINEQSPDKGCHSLWLDAYTSFMEQVYKDCSGQPDCEHFGDERLDEDRYFRLIAESTRQSSVTCYKIMQSSILKLMKDSYDSKSSSLISIKFRSKAHKSDRYYEQQKWSREMVKILQLVSGQDPDKRISLGEVARRLWEIKAGDEEESERFLRSLGEYAIANTDLGATDSDPQGVKRYARAMTRLCKPYIDEKLFLAKAGAIDLSEEEIKNKEPFLFYHIIYSLIRLTNHESIYDISKDQFEQDVLKNNWEALYLTTFACQMMSTTQGELSQNTNENAYEVDFQFDSSRYIEDWPLEVINEQLVEAAGKPNQASSFELGRPKVNFRTKAASEPADQQDEAEPSTWRPGHEAGHEPEQRSGERGANKGRTGSRRSSKTIGDYGDSLSSKLKKTFGMFKVGKKSPGKEKGGFMMSEQMIRKYYDSYGRWPELPADIHKYYPNLPAECGQQQAAPAGPKEVDTASDRPPSSQPKVLPAEPRDSNGQQAAGYWQSPWSAEDNLASWNRSPQVQLPPRKGANSLF